MPCDSSHLEPNAWETERLLLNRLLGEVASGTLINYKQACEEWGCYGVGDLDDLTKEMCAACEKLGPEIVHRSLELQMWWRDHQRADRKKKAKQSAEEKEAAIRKAAYKKLSPKERKALGLQ